MKASDPAAPVVFEKKYVVFFLCALSLFCLIISIVQIALPLATQDFQAYFTGREDFLRAYTVSQFALGGHAADIYDTQRYFAALAAHFQTNVATTPWLYSPAYLPAVHWLAWLPAKESYLAWIFVQTILFFALSYRFLWTRWYEALALFTPALALSDGWGQNGVLMAALCVGAFRWLKDKPVASGVFCGLCVIKPQLAVLLPVWLLAGRHYKALGVAVATAAVLTLLSLALYGADTWLAFLNTLLGNDRSILNGENIDRFALLTHYSPVSTPYHMLHAMGLPFVLSAVVQGVVSLYCLWETWRLGRRGTMDASTALACIALLASLCVPYFLVYDYVLVTAAVVGMVLMADMRTQLRVMPAIVVLAMYYISILHQVLEQNFGITIAPVAALLAYLYIARRGGLKSETRGG